MARLCAGAALAALSLPSGALAAATGSPPQFQWRIVALPSSAGASSFAEPGLTISPDGTAIADAATANTGAPPTAWLSHDSGSSWSTGFSFDTTGSSTGDADAALGSDGYRYALDLAYNPNPPGQPANPTVLVFRSADDGPWQGPASFPPPHGGDQPDRPWLFVDPLHPSDVDVVNSEGGGNIVVWRSQDHGSTFSGPTPVTGGANGQAALALSSRPLFDPTNDQRVFMLYDTLSTAGLAATLASAPPVYEFPMTQVWLAVSTDAGSTWSNRLALDTTTLTGSGLTAATVGHLLIASAVDGQGNLYAAFSLRQAASTPTSVYVMHSTDHGATWSTPAAIVSPMQSNVMPALAVAGGNAYLSWYGSADVDYRDASATWSELFAATSDPLAAQPSFAVSAIGGGAAHIGGIDTAGTIGSDLGANWGLRDFQSIAVDGCGLPHPVWAVDAGPTSTETAVPSSSSACLVAALPEFAPAPIVVLVAAGGALLYGARRRARGAQAAV